MGTLKALAKDLSTEFPRSPRDVFAGFVVAGRALDKCRAVVAETNGEYHFGCPLDNTFFEFAGIAADDFKAAVAEGKDDSEMAAWLKEKTASISREDVIGWNNKMRDTHISDMPIELQVFLEDYIPQYLPPGRPVYHWFDVYDIEEKRL